jgi:hypothetical protein
VTGGESHNGSLRRVHNRKRIDTRESLAFDRAPVRAAGPNGEYALAKASSLM